MHENRILLEDSGAGISTIVINRPEQRNAIDLEMWHRLAQVIALLQDDDETRVVVMRGAGDNAFASGADISELRLLTDRENHMRRSELRDAVFSAITNCRCPVIAMVNGFCIGAGCQLALACDLRIASDRSKFGIPAAKLGVVSSYSMTQRLVASVGPVAAKEILLIGEPIDAQRALQIGLVNRVVPSEFLAEVTYGIARVIAGNAPLSVHAAKRMIAKCLSYQEGIDHSDVDELEFQAFQSEDAAEGLRSFLEKRKPRWVGR